MVIKAMPKELRGDILRQSKDINNILLALAEQLKSIIKNTKRLEDIPNIQNGVNFETDEAFSKISGLYYLYGQRARQQALHEQITLFDEIGMKKKAPAVFKDYLQTANSTVRVTIGDYLNTRSRYDGRTINERLQTIRLGTQETVDAIVRRGIAEGKSSFQIAKEIENFLVRDGREKWVSPRDLRDRAIRTPIAGVYAGQPPKGAVNYNALRIARTETVRSYRYFKLDSTRGKPWVVGYALRLSPAHKRIDICDDKVSYDEGLGPGVYRDGEAALFDLHPHCMCYLEVMTIFHDEYSHMLPEFFDFEDSFELS